MTGAAPPSLDVFLASRIQIAESETEFAFLNLAGYDDEKTRAPLRAYCPVMLRRLDPRREIDRWKRESGSEG